MTKNMMLKALSEYMQAKNVDTISLSDYKADENAPVRAVSYTHLTLPTKA